MKEDTELLVALLKNMKCKLTNIYDRI